MPCLARVDNTRSLKLLQAKGTFWLHFKLKIEKKILFAIAKPKDQKKIKRKQGIVLQVNFQSQGVILVNRIKQIKPNFNCSNSNLIKFKIFAYHNVPRQWICPKISLLEHKDSDILHCKLRSCYSNFLLPWKF